MSYPSSVEPKKERQDKVKYFLHTYDFIFLLLLHQKLYLESLNSQKDV